MERNHSRGNDLVHFVDAFRRFTPSDFSAVRVTVDEYAEKAGRGNRTSVAKFFASLDPDRRGNGIDSPLLQQGQQDRVRMELQQVRYNLANRTQEKRAMQDDPIPGLFERLAPSVGLR